MTVLETLRCPGCSTRYVIGPARVRPGLRQARCYRCAAVFDIGEAVARLLAELPVPPTAAVLPEPPVPAAQAEEPPPAGAGFLSARDAIEKLLGQTAPLPPPAPVRMPDRDAMDLEAALQALDSTLGAAPQPALPPESEPEPEPEPDPMLQAALALAAEPVPESPAGPAPEPVAKADTASTVKLTAEDIRVAMAAATAALPVPEPAAPPPPEPVLEPEPAPGQELLKVMVEQETTQNVTLDQMTAWIEQGRVQEFHLVARQHSENWIEASKVPALRPAFDQVRKARAQTEAAKPLPEPPPVKRGLFSGLFGRN
jgi:predicted Zn finger-like uncharacterized protein